MTLDFFIKDDKEKSKKKSKKKTAKKSSVEKKSSIEIDTIKESNKQQSVATNVDASSFQLIKITLVCSAKCGYKKTIKKSKSFAPKDKDLICPKCGKKMKIKK
ncbi:MAG: hypothetical protein ACTSRZ_09300 [Promethearchaeota archaeon]